MAQNLLQNSKLVKTIKKENELVTMSKRSHTQLTSVKEEQDNMSRRSLRIAALSIKKEQNLLQNSKLVKTIKKENELVTTSKRSQTQLTSVKEEQDNMSRRSLRIAASSIKKEEDEIKRRKKLRKIPFPNMIKRKNQKKKYGCDVIWICKLCGNHFKIENSARYHIMNCKPFVLKIEDMPYIMHIMMDLYRVYPCCYCKGVLNERSDWTSHMEHHTKLGHVWKGMKGRIFS